MFAQASVGQRKRCVGSRGGDYARAHQPSAVEHDPHRLAALSLVLARDQVSATRARGPADVAHVVAFAVIAQAFEIAPKAPLAGLPQLEIDLSTAGQEYLLLFASAQGRIDAHGLGQRRDRPAFSQR